jgi:hypothetical protein
VDTLIARSELAEDLNLRFAALDDVLEFKKTLLRPKDLLDICLIQDYLARRSRES